MTPHIHKVIISIAPAQRTDWCHCDGRVLLSTCSQCFRQVPQVNDAMKRTLCSYHTFPHHFKGVNQLGLTCSLNVFLWKLKFYHWQTATEEHIFSIQLSVLILGIFIDFKQTSIISLPFCHAAVKCKNLQKLVRIIHLQLGGGGHLLICVLSNY